MPPVIASDYSPSVQRALRHYDEALATGKQKKDVKQREDLHKGLNLTLKDFVKYIVTLVNSQTPDNPMDPKELATFFLQFGNTQAVQHQTDMIKEMKESYESAQVMFAADQVGKIAEVKSHLFDFDPQEKTVISYEIPDPDTTSVDIIISRVNKREGGEEWTSKDMGFSLTQVASFPGQKEMGKHSFVWDGKVPDPNRTGQFLDAPQGGYHVAVVARDQGGNPLKDPLKKNTKEISTWVTGIVSGATRDETGRPSIKVGSSHYALEEVTGFEQRKGEDLRTLQEQRKKYENWNKEQKAQEKIWKETRRSLAPLDLAGLY